MRTFIFVLTLCLVAIGFGRVTFADGHLRALVIGNGAYVNVPEAANANVNAREMATSLETLGFDVQYAGDVDTISLWRLVSEFSVGSGVGGADEVVVVYFAGRTVVDGNQTFLLPVDAEPGPGIASRAILLDQIVGISAAGGGAVYAVLDLEKQVQTPNVRYGVGSVTTPRTGLLAIIERQADADLDDISGEAFSIVFSDEVNLPNLTMGPFIELVAAGAQSFTEGQLKVSIKDGAPSDVILNRESDAAVVARRLRLRAYDLSRLGSPAEIAAFSKLYPNYERTQDLVDTVSAPASSAQDLTGSNANRPVLFSVPLSGAGQALDGLTIGEVIKLKPKHAPIEGLPKAAWAEKTCSNCHKWNEAALCEHGRRYQGEIWDRVSKKLHPLGGDFKRVLRAWAAGGCQSE